MLEKLPQKELLEELECLRRENLKLKAELQNLNGSLERERLLANTLESIREGVSITDMNDILIYVNDAFLNIYGFSREEVIGKNISIVRSSLNPPETVAQILPNTINGGWEGEIYNRKKDGTDFLISLRTSIVRDKSGEPIGLVGACFDITGKKLAEETLRKSEENYRSLFEEIKDVVYVSSPEGKFLEINPAGIELFGYSSKEELLREDIASSFYSDPEARKKFQDKLEKDGYLKNYEISIRTRDGRKLTVLETSSAVKDKDGKIAAYRGILRDITFIKHTEAKLKEYVGELQNNKLELEKNAKELELLNSQLLHSELELKEINSSKDKFFSIIAHDLRSPFTSLIGLSGIIVSDCDTLSQEEIKAFATGINKSARNIFNLLENLLQWSRIQTGGMEFKPSEVDMCELAEQTVSMLMGNALKKNIELCSEIPLGSYVYADKNMISSVLQNLAANAVKFTASGGTVKMSCRELNGQLEVSVKDNGIGINEKDIDKLFRIDVHHTTMGTANEKGTGLGLALCKELVEKNRGIISVKSQPGEGSVFSFILPKEAEDKAEKRTEYSCRL
ncbi:MAG TPA: PAS domain-containing sensor histidine kinase [Ignavibacteriales bacterium]|nr:PAS domain-containing sensor histidine kinase [Ignavibacteriales bacterium]